MTTFTVSEPLISRRPAVLIIESPTGSARSCWFEEYNRKFEDSDARIFTLSCNFDCGGAWAGVNELFLALLPEIERRRPDLLNHHALELVYALPQLKQKLILRHPTLTDIASAEEKVRNYAADRAFRNVHGLIDLLDAWKKEIGVNRPWIFICDGYDTAGTMSRCFFQELERRRGECLNLHFIFGVEPGKGVDACASFIAGTVPTIITLEFTSEISPAPNPATAATKAQQLEDLVGQDRFQKQAHLPELINLWRNARRDDKVLHLQYFGLLIYLHLGQYADALRYADGLLPLAQKLLPYDDALHRSIVIKILNGLMGNQASQAALEAIEAQALQMVEHAPHAWRVDIFYLLAMVHARFRKPRDFIKGEEYLDRGLAALEQSGLPESQYHFQYVFNRNGVAMIRSFQARHNEAIELCLSGIDRLNRYVGAEKHRLHRSVLVYNIAQVYFATGRYQEAVEHYSAAMAMDPNYSEYYNERGNIFLRMGLMEEAQSDYLRAIELSPPYFEVFTNLGQCYRNMGKLEEAVAAYSRALDLQPDQSLALAGRAQAHEILGNREAAIADYSSALKLDPKQWEVIASRGVLHYEDGNLVAALNDFNCAIELMPDQPDLYHNRAIVLMDMGRSSEAVRDLNLALILNPAEEEKTLLQERLQAILQTNPPELC